MRRYSTLDKLPATITNNTKELGTYIMGASVTVNTPDGIGETDHDVYSSHKQVRVLINDDLKYYPVESISRVKPKR